jgi:hypothetical protein
MVHPTSLKLSKADKMISCPPLTRQTAAKSSKTRAFVLSKQEERRKTQISESDMMSQLLLPSKKDMRIIKYLPMFF